MWQIFCNDAKQRRPLGNRFDGVEELSLHRLLKLRKQMQDERQMWTCLTTTCKANFNMLRIGHYSVLIWEQNFRRWIQSVDVTWNVLNDNVFHKLVDEVETISPRRILGGLRHLRGLERSLRQMTLIPIETDAESSEMEKEAVDDKNIA
ncbi:hypothetical protein AK812_SmicGene44647, partial [Symbiodinium microadriaticum]